MSISISGEIVTNGLIVHYDALNQRSYPGSGTSWIDLTPYNNTASLDVADNPVTIANGYASFKADNIGSDDRYMTINSIGEINNATEYMTVDMWAKIPSNLGNNGSSNSFILGFEQYYGVSFEEASGNPTGKFGFTTNSGDIFGINNSAYVTSSLLNKWVHYSFVACDELIPSSSQKIYINSVPLALSQIDGSDVPAQRKFGGASVGNMAFGTRRSAASARATTYDAAIIKVYNRELTQAEVTQNFNAHKGRFNIY